MLIAFGLASYKMPWSAKRDARHQTKMVVATIAQMRHKYQLLLVPLTMWLGFSLAFIGADFTKSFVSCSLGVSRVGLAMSLFGVTDVAGSYAFPLVFKRIGRTACFLIGACINLAVIGIMLGVELSAENEYVLYMVPALWGVADSCWQTQVNSIYGVLFEANQEAAFSNFRLWESLGFAISYAYSSYLCTSTKLHLLVVYLSVGIVGYVAIEFMENERTGKNALLNYARHYGQGRSGAVLLIVSLLFVSYFLLVA